MHIDHVLIFHSIFVQFSILELASSSVRTMDIEHLRPEWGFTILSDGRILRGHPDSYDEDQVARWYAKWMMMKEKGVFDRARGPEICHHEEPVASTSASSSQSPFTPVMADQKDVKTNQKDTKGEIVQDGTEQTSDNKKKGGKQKKKNKKAGK